MSQRTYVKRLRMESPLTGLADGQALPHSFSLASWAPDRAADHAAVQWLAFRDSLDALVFPNLGRLDGCLQLMRIITDHGGFIPGATWLVRGREGYCGCVQGVREGGVGVIQNLAVVPDCQGRGLGTSLLDACLNGFRAVGLRAAQLEVSARNGRACRLYHEAGFQIVKTLYREIRADGGEYFI